MADFLKEPVLAALRDAGRPLDNGELVRALGIPKSQASGFRRFLRHLQREGDLYRVKGGRYAPPDRINLVVGRLSVIRSGAAFLLPEKKGEDVFVRSQDLRGACHGDKVVVRLEHGRRGRPAGRVVEVLERSREDLVGTLSRERGFVRVSPDDPKFPRDVLVPADETLDAREGEKVVVAIVDWGSDRQGPVGRVSEVLGMPGDPGLDVLTIIKHNGLPTEFPEEVKAAAAALPAEVPRAELRKRVDLRAETVVTIDPVSARDFDDALSLSQRNDGELELGIHIADVSHYVRHGSVIDEEARERGTSVYLADRVLPMLPEELSNGLCSLNPKVDRLAVSVLVGISARGRILDTRIEDTVIRSTRRLAYEDVQAFFDDESAHQDELSDVAELLRGLRRLSTALNRKRKRRGALDFDLPSTRVELDEEGLPLDIQKVIRLESHRLVEEFMLLANEVVARTVKEAGAAAVYRVHESPNPNRLQELRDVAERFGHKLPVDEKGRIPPSELQRLLRDVDDRPEALILNTLMLRSMARARYDVEPLGHYALALRDYTHFTSPIRRYPDLLVHRTLRILSGRQKPGLRDPRRYGEWLTETAAHASARERVADGAERDSVELKKLHFMERHVGEDFDGVVSGVESFGLFIELDRYHVTGLVHTSQLGDDYLEYREQEFALVGRRTRRRYALGDRARVKVAAVNRELRQIDFEWIEGGSVAKGGSRREKAKPARKETRRGRRNTERSERASPGDRKAKAKGKGKGKGRKRSGRPRRR